MQPRAQHKEKEKFSYFVSQTGNEPLRGHFRFPTAQNQLHLSQTSSAQTGRAWGRKQAFIKNTAKPHPISLFSTLIKKAKWGGSSTLLKIISEVPLKPFNKGAFIQHNRTLISAMLRKKNTFPFPRKLTCQVRFQATNLPYFDPV